MTNDIIWAWPWALLVLPLPLLAFLLLPAHEVSNARALRVPDLAPYVALSAQSGRARQGWLGAILLVLMWVALVIALARPQSFGDPLGVPVSGRDLMLCIDISGSMRETDLYAGNQRVTRMAVVKQVARDFVARRVGDRVGLIMFGSQAYVQTPLTYDHQTVQHFLDEAVVGLAGRSTAIGDAIGLGVKRLRDRPEASRVLILLTDGENSEGVVDPIDAARLAAQYDIRIHTIGVGSDPRSSVFGTPLGAQRGDLDERTLQTIAKTTGGEYFRARNQQELERIYREIDQLEPAENDDNAFRPLRELYVWPLAAALFLSVLWVATRRRVAGAIHV